MAKYRVVEYKTKATTRFVIERRYYLLFWKSVVTVSSLKVAELYLNSSLNKGKVVKTCPW